MNKVINLFEHFIESHVKHAHHGDSLLNNISLKLLATKVARNTGKEIPLYRIDSSKSPDTFSFWNSTESMRQHGYTSWHTGGVSCLCIEQYEDPELARDFLIYCPDIISDAMEDYFQFNLETFSTAAYLSLENNLISGYQNEGDKELADDRGLFEQLLNAEDVDEKIGILEELSMNWTCGISYAFHRKFEEHLDYGFLEDIAYRFLGMLSRSGSDLLCNGIDIDCIFFIHPKGSAVLAEGDELLSAYKEFLTNTVCHDCEVVICSVKDELAIGVLYNNMDNLDWISLATYLFIQRLDAVYKQQIITTENMPA